MVIASRLLRALQAQIPLLIYAKSSRMHMHFVLSWVASGLICERDDGWRCCLLLRSSIHFHVTGFLLMVHIAKSLESQHWAQIFHAGGKSRIFSSEKPLDSTCGAGMSQRVWQAHECFIPCNGKLSAAIWQRSVPLSQNNVFHCFIFFLLVHFVVRLHRVITSISFFIPTFDKYV